MKSTKKLTGIVVLVIAVLVLGFQFINGTGPFSGGESSNESKALGDKEKVHVKRVVDGDTLVAIDSKNQEIKVRLVGVDTPETVKPNTPVQPYGKEASQFTKKALTNKDVYLEYDKEPKDRYGRTLAYVWLNDKEMFNEQLVAKGLARAKYYAPNGKYRSLFEKREKEAQSKKLNIWSK